MKKITLFTALIIMWLVIFGFGASAVECTDFEGSNISAQNYSVWASPVKSHLVSLNDGSFMRVQYLSSDGRVLIEYYDSGYNLTSRKYIEKDLPVYGGFYAGADAYYILTGQNNPDENDSVEVFRITKYDKNWNRLSSAGLYGANTTKAFRAGSARFAESGNYLIIRTCHEMYTNPEDGLNHQANVTIQLDTENMKITDSYWSVMNSKYGYVSHSFNQFVTVDGGRIVALDHGDAYPRSIVLIKYKADVATGKFVPSYYNTCDVTDMFSISGNIGDNYTNCSVGGFAISDSTYIAAVNSINQGSSSEVRNIYVCVLDKSSATPVTVKLTDYTSEKNIPSTPHLVKISNNAYLVMWEKENRVCYALIDKNGNLKGSIREIQGDLSDCVPVISGGKIVWYVWNENEITFYEIDSSDLSKTNTVSRNTYHSFEIVSVSGTQINLRCTKCAEKSSGSIPSKFTLWWEMKNNGGYYSSLPESKYHPGEEIGLRVRYDEADYNEFEITSSDSNIVKITYNSYSEPVAAMSGEGTAKITIKSKYNPEIKTVYTIKSTHTWQENTVDATCTQSGKTVKTCSECSESKTETIPALGHDMSEYIVTKEPTCTAQGKKTATCSRCDEEVSEVISKLDHDKKTNIKATAATCTKSGKTAGKKCSMCGKVTAQQETIPALGHDMGEYIVTKEPTCTAQGKKVATCSRCDEEVSESIAKLAHDKKTNIKATAATCTKSGKTSGKKCSMCGKVTEEQETISALGHDMGEYIVTKEPTCTAQGKKVATCSRCDEEVSESIAKLEHDKKTNIKATAATCTKSGRTSGKKCSMCGKVTVEQETTPALGHDMGEYIVTKEPTCTAQGKKVASCSRCDEEVSEVISKLGHSYSEYEVTKEPTCTAQGEKTAYCARCEQTVTQSTARLPHKEVTLEKSEPTCIQNGKTSGSKCSVCGKIITEQEVIEKLGHDKKITVVTKATKENHGEISEECTRCGEKETQRVYMIKTVKMAKERYAYNGKTPKVSVKVIDSQKNVLKEGEDYTVSVGSAKKVGTHTAKITFKGKYEGSEKLSFDIVPGKTAKITASQSTSYIKLTWSKVSGATGYRVYQYDSKTKSYKLLTSIKGKNTYTVKKLKSGTTYKFAVKAYTKLSDGSVYWGSSVKEQFATKPAKTAIAVKSTAKKTAVISWNKVSGASGYQVYYSTAKDGKYTKLTNTTALSLKKTGLKSGKTYYFKVRAYKKVSGKTVYGAFSEIKSIKVK